jgi:hypothetical protein
LAHLGAKCHEANRASGRDRLLDLVAFQMGSCRDGFASGFKTQDIVKGDIQAQVKAIDVAEWKAKRHDVNAEEICNAR